MGEVLNNGVYLPDRGERNAYDGLKGNWNTLDSIAGKVPGYDGHIADTDIHVTAADKQTWSGKADASHVHNADDVTTGIFDAARIPNLDASKITTGTIDIDRLPQGALERLVKVADQAARYALTASDVQLGDTVQQLDTGVMYVVTDETKLDSADGYTEYTAGSATSVPWSGVTGKPADYTPASHSHGNISTDGKVGSAANKPLITGTGGVVQAGSFGNAANTFCEGNDSRLSDARTPVAHTHTKSDVTDLFNSNFIPSANNAYDLGSGSYQWNNLYAKNYYYNGTAWGLDKVNTWSAQQKIVGNNSRGTVSIYNQAYTKGSALSSTDLSIGSIYMGDGGQQGLANSLSFISTDLASNGARTLLSLSAIENTASSGTRTKVVIQYDKNDAENPKKVAMGGTVLPTTDATFSLGTSTNKWKTLNGINPGALGLPSGNYDPIDTKNWDLTGATGQSYTPTVNGWLFISIQNIAGNYLSIIAGRGAVSVDGTGAQTGLRAMLPVIANESVGIMVKTGIIFAARFYPMQGNVS